MEVQREENGAVEVESVLTVGMANQRMTVECVAFNLVGISRDTFAMEVSSECMRFCVSQSLSIHVKVLMKVFHLTGQTSSLLPP